MGPFYAALERAETPEDIVQATVQYLDSWTADMIRPLKAIDEGCAPFDARGVPMRIVAPSAIGSLHRAVLGLRRSLQEEDEQVPAEVLLLEQFLSVAASRLSMLALMARLKAKSRWSARANEGGKPLAPQR